MSNVIKEILTPSKRYKAEIVQREDGSFEVVLYQWFEDYVEPYGLIADGWESASRMKILVDSEYNAMKIAIQELRNLSGESEYM